MRGVDRRQHAQLTRHAQMQDQRARLRFRAAGTWRAGPRGGWRCRPRVVAIARSTGQRRRRSCTSRRLMRRPTTCGSMPRRVVSTSGSSGTCWLGQYRFGAGFGPSAVEGMQPLCATAASISSTNDCGWRRDPPAREPVLLAHPEQNTTPPPPSSGGLRRHDGERPPKRRRTCSEVQRKSPVGYLAGLFRLATLCARPVRGATRSLT